MRAILCLLLLVVSTSIPFAGAEAEQIYNLPPDGARRYGVYWTGVHVADMFVSHSPTAMDVEIKSYGLVKKISKFKSKTRTAYLQDSGAVRPATFHTVFQNRSRERKIDIAYDAQGNVLKESVVPPDNRKKRPAVSQQGKDAAVDPLTATLLARQRVIEARQKGEKQFNFPIYDGRRLSMLNFKIGNTKNIKVDGKKYRVFPLTFRRSPIEGHTDRELERMKEEEPTMKVYVTDDETAMPVRAEGKAPLGTAIILYKGEF